MDTDYADDIAVLDGLEDCSQESTDLLSRDAYYTGLKMSSRKTKTKGLFIPGKQTSNDLNIPSIRFATKTIIELGCLPTKIKKSRQYSYSS